MNAQGHTEFVDAFYRIGQDRANKIVILTGAGGNFIIDLDWSSFGDVSDPGVWSQVHDEGVQALENIASIRVPVIADVVSNGLALNRARELAELYLKAPEVTRRNTGVHFIHWLKEPVVREVGYGLSLEGASAADFMKTKQAKSEPDAQKQKSA
jgi:hypothetical protein